MTRYGAQFGPDITFLGVDPVDLEDAEALAAADVVVVGAPWDGGTSHRPGTRFGPQAIRGTDYLPHDGSRPHLALRVDALQDLRVVDAGDVEMPPGEQERSRLALEEAVFTVASAGAIPLVLGGDHSITLPDATGVARHRGFGKVSMIHFDAHADTGDIEFGSLYGHGQPMRRLIESGALRGDRFLQVGLRGYWPGPETLGWMAEQRMRSFEMTEIGKRGLGACLDEAFEIALDDCDAVFLSVDIDVCDPGHAPGTGTPEPGGLSSRELLDAVRRICRELPVAGIDVVEVSPPYDHAEITAFLANRVCLEALSGLAAAKVGITHDPAGTAPRGPMSTVFRAAGVFDGRRHLGATQVLVDGGRVVAVGPGLVGDETVEAAFLSPGFTDAHVHPIQGGLERLRCDLSELETRDDYLAAVRAYADGHPDAEWILGGGWAMPAFPGGNPLARDLDAVVPDRPVFLPNRDHHGAWVNSRALELAGITRGTPDPADGRIERDADGHPSGTLHEGATALVSRHLPPTTAADYRAALLAGQAYLHSLGVTGWQDAIVGAYAGMDDPGSTYVAAAANGELRSHVVGALWWDRRRGVEQVAELVARRDELGVGRFHPTSVKVMQDGVAENGTAALLEPYLDRCGHATDNRGHSFVDAVQLREAVRALDAAGFQVHVHAIGDRGVRETLDAMVGTDPARRHQVAHLQLVHPDDVARFAELGVAANMQALWACWDEQMSELTIPFLGEERSRWQYPFGAIHRAGGRLVAGSDWPVSTPDPLAAIHTAVTRTAYGDPGRAGTDPFLPEQAIDLGTAFAAYTSGSAWANGRDDAGVISVGAVADLVVLDRDPFAGPPEEIGAARVVSTWIDGVPVHG